MLRVDKIIKNIQDLQDNMTTYIHTRLTMAQRVGSKIKDDLAPVLEPLEDYLKIYIEEVKKNILPNDSKYKYIICLIHIIHIIGVLMFILFGFFMPPRLQLYVAMFYILTIITWIIFGKCVLVMLTNYIGGTNNDYLFPFRWKTLYLGCSTLIFLSLIFYIIPNISPFNLLLVLDNYSKKTLNYMKNIYTNISF